MWPQWGTRQMDDNVHMTGVMLAKEADARRGELQRERQVPGDLFQRAKNAGRIQQLICKELGGLGMSAVEWFRTGVEMARWEPSFAWVITQGAADHAVYVAAGDQAFVSFFLADANAYSSSSVNGAGTLLPEGDGYRLDGRWGFCSGCQGATWVGGEAVLARTEDQEVPEKLMALIPIERARIEETWDVMGMIGTGSHTVVVEAQHIPAAWAFRLSQFGPRDYGPMSVAAGLADCDIYSRSATRNIAEGTRRRCGSGARQGRKGRQRAADRQCACAAPADANRGCLVGGERWGRTGLDQDVAGCRAEPPAAH